MCDNVYEIVSLNTNYDINTKYFTVTYASKVLVQQLHISMYDFQHNKLIVWLVNSTTKIQTGIPEAFQKQLIKPLKCWYIYFSYLILITKIETEITFCILFCNLATLKRMTSLAFLVGYLILVLVTFFAYFFLVVLQTIFGDVTFPVD